MSDKLWAGRFTQPTDAFVEAFQPRGDIRITTVYEKNLLGSGGTVRANRDFVENEPSFLINTLDTIDDLREESRQRITEQTTANAKALFGL